MVKEIKKNAYIYQDIHFKRRKQKDMDEPKQYLISLVSFYCDLLMSYHFLILGCKKWIHTKFMQPMINVRQIHPMIS